MLQPAIRFIAAKGAAKPQSGSIQLLCHVKPGVSANREGISAVTSSAIEVCVAAQAREGEANKAVRELVAEVSTFVLFMDSARPDVGYEVMNVPKSDVEIIRGFKSREKTVQINNFASTKDGNPEEAIARIKNILEESATN